MPVNLCEVDTSSRGNGDDVILSGSGAAGGVGENRRPTSSSSPITDEIVVDNDDEHAQSPVKSLINKEGNDAVSLSPTGMS